MSLLHDKTTTPQAAAPEPSSTMFAQQTPTRRPETISEARLAANRENAQKSSGSVKHGLTGATVMFANADDAKNYARHVADYQQQLQPLASFCRKMGGILVAGRPWQAPLPGGGGRDWTVSIFWPGGLCFGQCLGV